MVTYKFRYPHSIFFFLTIFCVSFFLATNIFISQPIMETIDYITETEQPNPKHLALLQAKAQRELSSYDSQARVHWLEKKSKSRAIMAEGSMLAREKQKILLGKIEQFKRTLENYKNILKKSFNESDEDNDDVDDDDNEYTVNIGSVITDSEIVNYSEEDMYNNGNDYYNDDDDASKSIHQNQISDEFLKTNNKKFLLKFKSAKQLNTMKNIIQTQTEKEDLKESQINITKVIISNKDFPKSNLKNFPHNPSPNLIEERIFWSPEVENMVPKASSSENLEKKLLKIKESHIHDLQPPLWNKCGRPKNGFIILGDGTYMCARYRDPHNKLVLGEVLSFYLSHLLDLDNVPVVSLSQVNRSSTQWKGVNFHKLQWKEGNLVALIKWVPGISTMRSHVKMPEAIYNAYLKKEPLTGTKVEKMKLNRTELTDLLQWGSMLIFDYLTGNYDRVASMQDAAMKENRPSIMQEHIRNLRKSPKTGKFWLIDNESGLLDAYDLLYRDKISGKHFVTFHQQMLHTMCIFQKSIVASLQRLRKLAFPHAKLEEYAHQHEPLLSHVPKDYTYSIFRSMFSKRLSEVTDWIERCKIYSQ